MTLIKFYQNMVVEDYLTRPIKGPNALQSITNTQHKCQDPKPIKALICTRGALGLFYNVKTSYRRD